MLSDTEIMDELGRDILIHPFKKSNLGPNSYDISLGEWFYVEEKKSTPELYDIYDQISVNNVWKLVRASVVDSGPHKGKRMLLLAPGQRVLGHSEEFIGGRHRITTMIKSRSSIGRSGISTCLCAGSGDIGYINRWTLEISNHLQCHFVPLIVGERIAQVTFFHTGICANPYIGNYQPSIPIAPSESYDISVAISGASVDCAAIPDARTSIKTIEFMIQQWKPEMMLPKLKLDK